MSTGSSPSEFEPNEGLETGSSDSDSGLVTPDAEAETLDENASELIPDASVEVIEVVVEARAHGWRSDQFLTRLYPNFSRSAFHRVFDDGGVSINGQQIKMSRRLHAGETLCFRLPQAPSATVAAEDIPLDIIYDDEWLTIINKPANMIVHPGRGHTQGTLAAALQFHFDKLSDVAGKYRAGIVHRLDRDTSGVLVVAKNNEVHAALSSQFEQRSVEKEYRAIAWGEVAFDRDYIETHVRVSQRNRERMMVCPPGGNSRHAATFYEVVERFTGFTFLRLVPQTGRTHQLRVHLHHLRHPIVADRLYEGRTHLKLSDLVEDLPDDQDQVLIERQALHALSLAFDHPITGARMKFEAPLPDDFQRALSAIMQHRTKPVRKPKLLK